jgi:hypothetical protein
MTDVLGVWSEVISSTIADRIRELGGTDRDVREIAKSAAFAIFVRSAGELLGSDETDDGPAKSLERQ